MSRRRRSTACAGYGRYAGGRPRRGDDVDDVAVERAMYGDPVPLNVLERRLAVRRLTALGYSALQIAERLHIAPRTVVRHREHPPQDASHSVPA